MNRRHFAKRLAGLFIAPAFLTWKTYPAEVKIIEAEQPKQLEAKLEHQAGTMFYNFTEGYLYIWEGNAWCKLSVSSDGGKYVFVPDKTKDYAFNHVPISQPLTIITQ